ncbi:hypothetical protein PENSTE_c002G02595 [Penicillium steckii]|uniref:Uncharacterized protein n=1 Tax=Penicillium steckii TaxID=303698 RepID=A0A1V6TT68_9EURO|nr:hypothetical protein PENSTE_c002G02595 [Penicillium steckii]
MISIDLTFPMRRNRVSAKRWPHTTRPVKDSWVDDPATTNLEASAWTDYHEMVRLTKDTTDEQMNDGWARRRGYFWSSSKVEEDRPITPGAPGAAPDGAD